MGQPAFWTIERAASRCAGESAGARVGRDGPVLALDPDRDGPLAPGRQVRDAAERLEIHGGPGEPQRRARGTVATEETDPFERDIDAVQASGFIDRPAESLLAAHARHPADRELDAATGAPPRAHATKAREERQGMDEVDVLPQARAFAELDAALAREVPALRVDRRRQPEGRVVYPDARRRIEGDERPRLQAPLRPLPLGSREMAPHRRPRRRLRGEGDRLHAHLLLGQLDAIERGPQASGIGVAERVERLPAACTTGGREQDIPAVGGHAGHEARGRNVFMAVQEEHGAPEGMERRERGTGPERGHRELFAVRVGDERGQGPADEPAHHPRRPHRVDMADVRDGRRDEVMMDQEDERAAVTGQGRMGLEEVFEADRASGADEPSRQVRRVVGDDVSRQTMELGGDDLREERRAVARDIDAAWIDGVAQGQEERLVVGSEQAETSPVVVARQDDGRGVAAERVYDAAV